MIEDEPLTRLAGTRYPATTRPISDIVRRANVIRRSRRLYATGALGAAATAVTTLSVLSGLPLPGQGGSDVRVSGAAASSSASSSASSQDCNGGYAYHQRLSTMPELAFLPSVSSAGPITGPVIARRETGNCDFVPPQAVAYALHGQTVSKRVAIGGPGARNQYGGAGTNGAEFGGLITHPVIGGARADLYGDPEQSWLYLYWTGTDGAGHELQSDGVSRAELGSLAQSLRFDHGGRVDTSHALRGLPRWAQLPVVALDAGAARQSRYVSFSFQGGGSAPGWIFEVRDRATYTDAPFSGQQVQIGASTGWWRGDGAGGGKVKQGRLTWRVGGVELEIAGNSKPLDLQQALRIARSVTKVSPSDPRITAVKEV